MTEKQTSVESKDLLTKAVDQAFDSAINKYLETNALAGAVVGYLSRRARAVIREEVRAAIAEALATAPNSAAPVEKPKRARKAKAETPVVPASEKPEAQDTQGVDASVAAESQPAPAIAEEDLPSTGAETPTVTTEVPAAQPVPETVQETPAANTPVGVDYMNEIRPLCATLVSINAAAIKEILKHFGVGNMKDVPAERLAEAKAMLEEAIATRQAA